MASLFVDCDKTITPMNNEDLLYYCLLIHY
jgi:hypothetical protein